MDNSRLRDIKRFYSIIDLLEKKNANKKLLSNWNGNLNSYTFESYFI